MKNALFLLFIFILSLFVFAALAAGFFVLYPGSPPAGLYSAVSAPLAAVRTIDIFFYAGLSLLPLCALLSLFIVELKIIKSGSHTMLNFLTYVFLCLLVWLIIIPLCLMYRPEQRLSRYILGQGASPASALFERGISAEFNKDPEKLHLAVPDKLRQIGSGLFLLRNLARSAAAQGRFVYLLFASMALPFFALYALIFISRWKLISAVSVLLGGFAVFFLNIEMYKSNSIFSFWGIWLPLILNGAFALLLLIAGTLSFFLIKRRKGAGL